MDQELIAYLDRRFRETSQQISEEISSLRQDTTQQITSLRQETTQQFEKVDERLQELKDTGRHTLVLVEDLRKQIQQVAEGVAGANQRLDAFKVEARAEIMDVRSFFTTHNKNLEGRVQILEAKAARPRRSNPRPT
jgi:chromosome segregation ATPase